MPKRRGKIRRHTNAAVPSQSKQEFDRTLGVVPVFHPTIEEFNDPIEYITSIQLQAEKAGICKVVPPDNWKPCTKFLPNRLSFRTREQRLSHLLGTCWESRRFMEHMRVMLVLKGRPCLRKDLPPRIEKHPVDLHALWKLAITLTSKHQQTQTHGEPSVYHSDQPDAGAPPHNWLEQAIALVFETSSTSPTSTSLSTTSSTSTSSSPPPSTSTKSQLLRVWGRFLQPLWDDLPPFNGANSVTSKEISQNSSRNSYKNSDKNGYKNGYSRVYHNRPCQSIHRKYRNDKLLFVATGPAPVDDATTTITPTPLTTTTTTPTTTTTTTTTTPTKRLRPRRNRSSSTDETFRTRANTTKDEIVSSPVRTSSRSSKRRRVSYFEVDDEDEEANDVVMESAALLNFDHSEPSGRSLVGERFYLYNVSMSMCEQALITSYIPYVDEYAVVTPLDKHEMPVSDVELCIVSGQTEEEALAAYERGVCQVCHRADAMKETVKCLVCNGVTHVFCLTTYTKHDDDDDDDTDNDNSDNDNGNRDYNTNNKNSNNHNNNTTTSDNTTDTNNNNNMHRVAAHTNPSMAQPTTPTPTPTTTTTTTTTTTPLVPTTRTSTPPTTTTTILQPPSSRLEAGSDWLCLSCTDTHHTTTTTTTHAHTHGVGDDVGVDVGVGVGGGGSGSGSGSGGVGGVGGGVDQVGGFVEGPYLTFEAFKTKARVAETSVLQAYTRVHGVQAADVLRKIREESIDENTRSQRFVDAMEEVYWDRLSKPWLYHRDAALADVILYGSDLDTDDVRRVGAFQQTSPSPCGFGAGWNLKQLPQQTRSLLRHVGGAITGVTVPWLYVGSPFSSFCCHTEDHDLFSINFQHSGEPKMWYACAGTDAIDFESCVKELAPELFASTPDVLTQLVTTFHPLHIAKHVDVVRTVQQQGEFVVTMPGAYHWGFNLGININEAVNFASDSWLPWGQRVIDRDQLNQRSPVVDYQRLLIDACKDVVNNNTASQSQQLLSCLRDQITEYRSSLAEVTALIYAAKTTSPKKQSLLSGTPSTPPTPSTSSPNNNNNNNSSPPSKLRVSPRTPKSNPNYTATNYSTSACYSRSLNNNNNNSNNNNNNTKRSNSNNNNNATNNNNTHATTAVVGKGKASVISGRERARDPNNKRYQQCQQCRRFCSLAATRCVIKHRSTPASNATTTTTPSSSSSSSSSPTRGWSCLRIDCVRAQAGACCGLAKLEIVVSVPITTLETLATALEQHVL